jgi:hypothetical protein
VLTEVDQEVASLSTVPLRTISFHLEELVNTILLSSRIEATAGGRLQTFRARIGDRRTLRLALVSAIASAAVAIPATASASGWNVAWDKPAPQLSVALTASVLQDSNGPTEVFWTDTFGGPVLYAQQTANGWTVPVSLGGATLVPRAARENNFGTVEFVATVGSWDVYQNPQNGQANYGAGLWINFSPGDGTWSGWHGLGGVFASPYPAIAVVGNDAAVFGIGTDDQIYHQWVTGPTQNEGGWDRLPVLPNGNLAATGFQSLSAAQRGANNAGIGSLRNRIIDIVVLAQNNTVWHTTFNTSTGAAAAWDQVPSPLDTSSVNAVYVTSTDLSTVDILEVGSGVNPWIFASSSPGSWSTLPIPQGWRNCPAGGFSFTSSSSGVLDFYEIPDAVPQLYHDQFGPNPSSLPGLAFCR